MAKTKKSENVEQRRQKRKKVEPRKETLLQEYKKRNKTSIFVDKRFGEYDNEVSLEERMLQRFTLEKQKHHENRKLYNLEEDEDLTHYGQSLAEMTNFDDADLKLTDDEDEGRNEEAQFGGFLKKVEKGQDRNENTTQKSRKEIMDEIVAKSKIKKFERQQAKEEAFQLTQDLDTDWKMIHSLLTKRDDAEFIKADDYDILVNELKYETKAKPKDRMKTEEEIAKAEKEKLEKLEEERLQRMNATRSKAVDHLSADYLGDGHVTKEDTRVELIFKDGKAVLPEGVTQLKETSESEGDSEEDDSEGDDESEAEDSENDEDEDDDESEDHDSYDENDEDLPEDDKEMDSVSLDHGKSDKRKKKVKFDDEPEDYAARNGGEKELKSNTDGEPMKELPYTFEAPNDLDDFLQTVQGWTFDQQLNIIDRIRKCHPPKLEEKNKNKMQILFSILIKYIDHLCEQERVPMTFINKLARPLFELAKDSPHHAAREIQRRLRQSFKRFWMKHQTSGGRNAMPNLKEVILLNLISTIYPTSDLKHGITTPAMTFMTAVLSKSYFQTTSEVISGLLISNTILKYLQLSRRFVPEVINFLCGVLSMAANPNEDLKYKSTLRVHDKNRNCLFLAEKITEAVEKIKISSNLENTKKEELRNIQPSTRASIMRTCLHQLMKFAEVYKDLPSFTEIFYPVKQCIDVIPCKHYYKQIRKMFSELKEHLMTETERQPLTLLARKPMPLPLLEPMFDESYEVKSKKRSKDKDVNERNKLKYKYKKEMKGAIREIRKDSHFLAKEKLQERLDKDAERARKTKEIERQLADQQGELKALNKVKRKNR
eukprot:Seg4357.4 transcript_id=Seg4357.4/GoldUCD/mRNA.D3Y31 product="Nucleolar protein 14" protein_id=Seg4357.4/GoldUCD/D3Y31